MPLKSACHDCLCGCIVLAAEASKASDGEEGDEDEEEEEDEGTDQQRNNKLLRQKGLQAAIRDAYAAGVPGAGDWARIIRFELHGSVLVVICSRCNPYIAAHGQTPRVINLFCSLVELFSPTCCCWSPISYDRTCDDSQTAHQGQQARVDRPVHASGKFALCPFT